MPSPADAFQTLTQLRELLDRAGAAPRRRFGQNFLIDRNLMNKLIESADLHPGDVVLEVGAGTGGLTGLVAPRVSRLIAVEIDDRLAGIAAERLKDAAHVSILNIDALARKSQLAPQLIEAIAQARPGPGGATKLVGNLPYDIATSLIMNILIGGFGIARLCFTVQREVADRFLAAPGTADYGPVSVLTSLLTTARRVAKAPASAFWPRPKVESSMLRLDVLDPPPLRLDELPAFVNLVRSFFLKRRKTLGAIARGLPGAVHVAEAIARTQPDSRARPEDVSPRHWLDLFRSLA